ncbi:MAG: hypothetical protein Q4C89_03740 [Deinococcus sp.]|uniref:DUF7668 domain-containing protein n=1 Tax=Deinococcus sp. TaxID=47478 RepID=UPI0026DCA320|nr:hypothetical protein [Deinococcus sp.]MDO4245115.1 hypothetical protein [Deinococcus sp.]
MSPFLEEARSQIRATVEILVSGHYERLLTQHLLHPELQEITEKGLGGLPIVAEEIQRYPGTMTMPPETAFQSIDFYAFDNDIPDQYLFQVNFTLWFDDEPSDLTAIFNPDPKAPPPGLRLSDVHVL